ncbi:MAG: low affinity iron permease family protein [Bacteroidota bacterium]
MKKTYIHLDRYFEKLTSISTALLGNSITFILACCLVFFWWGNNFFYVTDVHQIIGDIIFGITFLSLFIIQKSFNRFSALLHLKVNELVSSHEPANNAVMNTGGKTEHEIRQLSKEYIETDEKIELNISEKANRDTPPAGYE